MKVNLFLLAMMAFLAGLNELVLAGILPYFACVEECLRDLCATA